MPSGLATSTRSTVSVLDVPLALLAPKRVFARVEDVPAYGWSLVLLLAMVTLIGYATVETGLIDLEVDRGVQHSIAMLESQQLDVVERSALSKMIEDEHKQGEFLRLMARVRVVVAEPIMALTTVLLLGALYYGLVALSGKKPEWHTLLTIMVFASFADVVGKIVQLGFMLSLSTLYVETSLAPLARVIPMHGENPAASAAALSGLLSAIDPFRIWFWILVIVGLKRTSQLRGWKVWTSSILFWLVAAGARAAVAVAMAMAMATSSAQPPA